MDTLLEKSKIDERQLTKFVRTISTNELSNLSEPCYYPQLKKYKFELLRICNLKENDIKQLPKRLFKGTKWSRFQLHNDDYTNFLIFIMYYFSSNENQIGFTSTMLLYVIRQYSNLMHRSIKYCNEEIFKYALDSLSNIHLFKREKTIGNALHYLSEQYIRKYSNSIKKVDVDNIGKFIQESRHRINQSVKSFAELYYQIHEKQQAYKKPLEIDGQEIEVFIPKGATLIDKFVKTITIYRQFDKKAFDVAINKTKVDKRLAEEIVVELAKSEYSERLTIILRLLLNQIEDLDTLCSDEFLEVIKNLMSIKRTKEKIYYKQQVIYLLENIISSLNKISEYEKLNDRNKFFLFSFLSYYISISFRNYLC